MISFKIVKFDNASNNSSLAGVAPLIERILNVAGAILSRSVDSAANAVVAIDVEIAASGGYAATGSPIHNGSFDEGLVNRTVFKLKTGKPYAQTDENTRDAVLTINGDFLIAHMGEYSAPDAVIGEHDHLVDVMVHEVLHMLGLTGFLDRMTGQPIYPEYGVSWLAPYDRHVIIEGNEVTFGGPFATAIYGAVVPLHDLGTPFGPSSIYHVDAMGDLMHFALDDRGGAVLSDLDIAMLIDVGLRNARTLVSNDGHTFVPGTGQITVSGTTSLDTALFNGALGLYEVRRGVDGLVHVTERAAPANSASLADIEQLHFSNLRLSAAAVGTTGDDVMAGAGSTDTFFGGRGNDTINGKDGVDVAVFSSSAASYTITRTASGLTVADNSGYEGSDVLQGVERLWFGDKQLAFDIDGNAGDIYRLYQAAFDREPDHAGLGYWMGAVDGGLGLGEIAALFMESTEFIGMYGAAPSAHSMLTKFYEHVLHRAPEAGGFDWWLEKMSSGVPANLVLQSFADSPENQQQVLASIVGGIEYDPWG